LSTWDGEVLPEQVQTPGGPAFPALVDEGKTVGVRAFTNPAEAAESHRRGGARLLWLAHPDQVAYLTKKFPLGMMAKVELPRLGVGGTKLEDLILVAAEGAAGGAFPRSPDDFAKLRESARGRWYEAASNIGKALDETLAILPEIRMWIEGNQNNRNFAEVAEDLGEQLEWLFRGEFAWRARYGRLLDYPRYLRGMRSRLGRIVSLPLVKDLEKMDRLRRLWTPWFQAWTAEPDNPAHWELGWMLEEYRIATFAPDVPVKGKVSEKRIGEDIRILGY
jgi:ATP-dependent helicase HrpA